MKKAANTRKKITSPSRETVTPNVDPRFAPVVEAFVKDRQVTYGKMFASMGLKINGKIFAMHVKGRFVAKLPRERVDELVRQGKGEYFDPGHGRLMKEWVALTGDTPSWVELAREAHRFVKGIKAGGRDRRLEESDPRPKNQLKDEE
jgi:TfoX/Sxy family transcriptional regulator of competence genes